MANTRFLQRYKLKLGLIVCVVLTFCLYLTAKTLALSESTGHDLERRQSLDSVADSDSLSTRTTTPYWENTDSDSNGGYYDESEQTRTTSSTINNTQYSEDSQEHSNDDFTEEYTPSSSVSEVHLVDDIPADAKPKDETATVVEISCFAENYQIQKVCSLSGKHMHFLGANLTLEDIYGMLYKDFILSDLSDMCDDRTWCLSTYTAQVLHEQTNGYMSLCDLSSCLVDIPDDCINEKRRFTLSTFMLLCNAMHAGVDEQCTTVIKQMLHVTRSTQLTHNSMDICTSTEKENCSGSCSTIARQLQCMCHAACDNGKHKDIFQQFAPWQWVFSAYNDTSQCPDSSSYCADLNFQLNSFVRMMQKAIYGVQEWDKPYLAGVSAGIIVALIVSIYVLVMCVKKYKYGDAPRRDYIKYHEVTAADMEYDSDV